MNRRSCLPAPILAEDELNDILKNLIFRNCDSYFTHKSAAEKFDRISILLQSIMNEITAQHNRVDATTIVVRVSASSRAASEKNWNDLKEYTKKQTTTTAGTP